MEDGALRIFLNTRTKALLDLDQKLQAFYHYLQEGTAESTLTKEISSKIRTLKNNSLARRHYMTLALKIADIRYDAFEEGLEQGREQGAYQNKLETAKAFLSEGLAPQMVARCTSLPLDVVQELAQTK